MPEGIIEHMLQALVVIHYVLIEHAPLSQLAGIKLIQFITN